MFLESERETRVSAYGRPSTLYLISDTFGSLSPSLPLSFSSRISFFLSFRRSVRECRILRRVILGIRDGSARDQRDWQAWRRITFE